MVRSKLALAVSVCALAVGVPATSSQAQNGWTDLTPPAGAQVFYVAATGNDSNPGTQAAPFRTIHRGYAALRDGWPDQVRLRCGDVWDTTQVNITKGCNTPGQYQVIGSYGTGPRPRLHYATGAGFGAFRGEAIGKRGVAITGLELVGTNLDQTSGILFLTWRDVLIEDCYVRQFRDNIVIQGFGGRCSGIKIRRNVITDARYAPHQFDPYGNPMDRAMGVYMDLTDDWLFEGNYFEKCGIPGSIFGRPVYIQSDCGRGVYRDNIMANNPSEGVQVRPGGYVHNNLSIRNPIGLFVGDDAPGTNDIQYNVVIESGDVNPNDRRGIGLHVNGPSVIRNNVFGYNTGTGWGAVKGIYLNSVTGECSSNYIFDWTRSDGMASNQVHEGHGIHVEGGGPVTVSANTVYQIRPGIVCEQAGGTSINGSGDRYYWNPASLYLPFRPLASLTGWASVGATPPADPRFRVSDISGLSLDAWMIEARKQSRQYWRQEYTAPGFNAVVRARVGGGTPPPTSCYANCDGSTAAPILNPSDFVCFLNAYAAGSSYANCDGSTGNPTLTAVDFQCFLDKYVAGCQ